MVYVAADQHANAATAGAYAKSLLLAAGRLGLTPLLSSALERFLFRPFVRSEVGGMILSLDIAICLQSGMLILLGAVDRTLPRPVTGILRIGEAVIPLDRMLVRGCAVLIILLF